RYKNKKNIIWILGGDRTPRNDADVTIWRRMAAGVQDGVGGKEKALMTFHPQPNGMEDGGSSKWFHQDEWLDLNMFQTGHCRENNVWDRIAVAYNKTPVKPVIDGEPIYEDHPVCFNATDLGTSSAYDIRKNAYLDVLSGTCGHTYGCHDIWQFYDPSRVSVNGPHFPWYVAMDLPGANQMKYLKHLMEARPVPDRVPDVAMIVDPLYEHNRIHACRSKDYILVYSSEGFPFELKLGNISGKQLQAYWYDPKNGKSTKSDLVENAGTKKFIPPSKGYGKDWVLVLDNVDKKYADPGFPIN
ncbi:MAG: glycoside hydrolase family 140 protein, partial [Saprospiraceae bacterium]